MNIWLRRKPQQARKLRRGRRLVLESLEGRRLFAADSAVANFPVGESLTPSVSWKDESLAPQATERTQALAERFSQGGVVDLPAGIFLVSRPLLNQIHDQQLLVRGAGPGLTILRLTADLDQPLLSIKNSTADVRFSDLTFDGDGHRANAIRLVNVANAQFERVEFREFQGRAIAGQQVTNTVFDGCHFVRCGDPATNQPAVYLASLDPTDAATSTHDVNFMACRFEANNAVSLLLGRGTHDVVVFSNKFHGLLPTPAPFDHLQLNGAFENAIVANNFVRGGGTAIRLSDSQNNTVRLNQVAKNDGHGIQLIGSSRNTLTDNVYAPAAMLKNGHGDLTLDAQSRQNVVSGRESFAGATTQPLDWSEMLEDADSSGEAGETSFAISPALSGQDITEQLAALIQSGGKVSLPEGVFYLSRSLGQMLAGSRLSLVGSGVGKTILRLADDLSAPLFDVRGTDRSLYNWLHVSDITFDGAGHQADAFRIERLMLGNFTNVEFRNFRGAAIDGVQFWDTDFRNCQFVQCGDAARQKPAIVLDARNARDGYTNSNNINFIECSFEQSNYIALDLKNQTAKVKVLASDFVGGGAGRFPQVRLNDTSGNMIVSNDFYHLGRESIVLHRSHGDVVAGNRFDLRLTAEISASPTPAASAAPPPPPVIPASLTWSRLSRGRVVSYDDAPALEAVDNAPLSPVVIPSETVAVETPSTYPTRTSPAPAAPRPQLAAFNARREAMMFLLATLDVRLTRGRGDGGADESAANKNAVTDEVFSHWGTVE
jgi:parallel beta-helix repeat protein